MQDHVPGHHQRGLGFLDQRRTVGPEHVDDAEHGQHDHHHGDRGGGPDDQRPAIERPAVGVFAYLTQQMLPSRVQARCGKVPLFG